MDPMLADLKTIQTIGVAGISFYVIKELVKLLHFAIQQKRLSPETTAKENSRDAIQKTYETMSKVHEDVKVIKEGCAGFNQSYYDMRQQMDNMSRVILAQDGGQYIIYNPNLHKSLDRLNNTMERLADKLK